MEIEPHTIELHPAGEEHLEILLPLIQAYHEFEEIPLSGAQCRATVERLLGESPYGRIWLASLRGEYIGYIAICFGYSIELNGRDGFVDEFFIREAYRNKGVGSQILKQVVSMISDMGVKALHLEVARTNVHAQKLYAKCGFSLRGRYMLMSYTAGKKRSANNNPQ